MLNYDVFSLNGKFSTWPALWITPEAWLSIWIRVRFIIIVIIIWWVTSIITTITTIIIIVIIVVIPITWISLAYSTLTPNTFH